MALSRKHGLLETTSPFAIIDAAALGLALLWFLYNHHLPDLYRGKICCDSVSYIVTAQALAMPAAYLHGADPTIGYPIYLWLFRTLEPLTLAILNLHWVDASLWALFGMYITACHYLSSALRDREMQLHRIVFPLLVLSPGIVSHTAIPLTDALATVLLMMAFILLIRIEWDCTPRICAKAAGVGLLLAWIVLARPSHYFPVLMLLGSWLLLSCLIDPRRLTALSFIPLTAIAAFALATAPRHIRCSLEAGTFCFIDPVAAQQEGNRGLHFGLTSARVYTVLAPANNRWRSNVAIRTVEDHFLKRWFGDSCVLDNMSPVHNLIRCLLPRTSMLPVFVLKKTIGLFDNFHLNTYAVTITTLWQITLNRAYGIASFMGCCAMLVLLIRTIIQKRWRDPLLLPMLYCTYYLLFSVPLYIESRYGLPLVPLSIICLVYAIQTVTKRPNLQKAILLGFLCLCGLVMFIQVRMWDHDDPLFPGNPKRADVVIPTR